MKEGPSRVRDSDDLLEFERLAVRGALGCFEPNADVLVDETDGAFIVHVELAGADAESLRVTVDDAYLIVTGKRTPRGVPRTASLLRKEIASGEFHKAIHLPLPVAPENASALHRDGVLTVRLPLAPAQKHPIIRTTIRMTVKRTPV
ncbi:MAG TPA: Hsp20/alpha crystallin family protein [Candidatus Sulfotelmatobacter sp.]|nr:Hsp20/alpha crystallin family protein [Candidatus Sulfotelmatobacter sp.]